MQVELSPYIGRDLEEFADWIAQDNPGRVVSFIQEIREAVLRIGEAPLIYQLRPEISGDARLTVVGRYVILFRIAGEMVRIERVVYGGRYLPELM